MPSLGSTNGYGRQQLFKGYRYWRFAPAGSTTTQVARVYFYTGTTKQTVFSDSTPAVTVTNPGGSNPVGEGPTNVNLTANPVGNSKWLDFNNGPAVFQFPTPQSFTGYDWFTANDTTINPGRQPTSWTVSGSYDGTTWRTLHTANQSSVGWQGTADNSLAYTVRNAWTNTY
jgi:hypothetical protein